MLLVWAFGGDKPLLFYLAMKSKRHSCRSSVWKAVLCAEQERGTHPPKVKSKCLPVLFHPKDGVDRTAGCDHGGHTQPVDGTV